MVTQFHVKIVRGTRSFIVTGRRKITERRHEVTVSEGTVEQAYEYPVSRHNRFGCGLAEKAVNEFVSGVRRR